MRKDRENAAAKGALSRDLGKKKVGRQVPRRRSSPLSGLWEKTERNKGYLSESWLGGVKF